MAEMTPMMQQYMKIKEANKDTILFYRLGDFYEMFFDDAKTVSRELELVLTGRDCGMEERAPMCGIPFHAADSYIARLIAKGYKVAVCEQLEDPALAKGIVKRDIIRIVTPGTVTDSVMLDETKNNYIASVCLEGDKAGFAFCDISTGELNCGERAGKDIGGIIINELARFDPSELISNEQLSGIRQVRMYLASRPAMVVSSRDFEEYEAEKSGDAVRRRFGEGAEASGLSDKPLACAATGVLLKYLYSTEKNTLGNISAPKVFSDDKILELNAATRRNLELTETERRREKKGSLLWVLDRTKTAPGKRTLRSFVEQPLVGIAPIIGRLNAVEELYDSPVLCSELASLLSGISDMERISTRIVYGTANAKELRSLYATLMILPKLKAQLANVTAGKLRDTAGEIDEMADLAQLIDSAISDDPPFSVREGGMIRSGYNAELDELRTIVNGGKDFLADIENREQERTGIKKLKIGYNRVYGYYIEILNTFRDMVPDDYIRKQTLTNCERYITPELKELESKVLGAQERIASLEYELFNSVREEIAASQARISGTGRAIGRLDAFLSLAVAAVENGYVRPDINTSGVIDIKAGRHPVVEHFLDGAPFVPNDVYLDRDDNRTLVITGPNMAGKSTFMRQTAIIVLMAQMGSFVPAQYASVGVVDRIFTRVGASDDLIGGQSTFMTEMSEVSSILSNATRDSLIILDEIGRGTSTFDGMAIARAVLEYVTDKKKIGAKTLFATHYHELTELEGSIKGVKNFNTSVKKRGDDITFLRRIVPGPADGSYGIEVAKLSGIPQSVVSRAKVILKDLESSDERPRTPVSSPAEEAYEETPSLFADVNNSVIGELKAIDVNTLTPIEALTKLYELKTKIN